MKLATVLLTVVLLAVIAAPANAAGAWKNCGTVKGNRVSANKATSCALARKVARHDMEDFADGVRVRVKSPVNGRTYRFFLWYADAKRFVVHADAARGNLSVQVRY
jgi:hypothetical protein